MIKRTFLDKCNTIIKGSTNNTGLNPVAELNYGADTSRALIHFDIDGIRKMYNEGTFSLSGTTHTLKLTNCGSVNNRVDEMLFNVSTCVKKHRASSFDLIAFRLPSKWDLGNGYDFNMDYWVLHNQHVSKNGCNWYQSKDGTAWKCNFFALVSEEELYNSGVTKYRYDEEEVEHMALSQTTAEELWGTEDIFVISPDSPQEGIYTSEQLLGFIETNDKKIIDIQHFDVGNENMEFDITSYVEDVLVGDAPNNGIGIAFHPNFELQKEKSIQYVGFFTNMTHTFFHPVVESRIDRDVIDSRNNFVIGYDNKLYLYVSEEGVPLNLDVLPTCTIDGKEYPVKQEMTGIYSATIYGDKEVFNADEIYYDEWSNILYDGNELDDVEMEFVPKKRGIHIGASITNEKNIVPYLWGINDGEKIPQGTTKRVFVEYRRKFTTEKKLNINNAKYRLYVKDGNREVNVIDYDNIIHAFMQDFFYIETNSLIPNVYHIDIYENGKEHRNVLEFEVISNVTERYV